MTDKQGPRMVIDRENMVRVQSINLQIDVLDYKAAYKLYPSMWCEYPIPEKLPLEPEETN